MTESRSEEILEHLMAIRAGLEASTRKFDEITEYLERIEQGLQEGLREGERLRALRRQADESSRHDPSGADDP